MLVRGVVNGKARRKCYPIVFCCINTGAVHIGCATSYCTDGFMKQFEKFCTFRGVPNFIYTDMGSNLVKARKLIETSADIPTVDWEGIKAATAAVDITWKHCPAQSQWRDGISERVVAAMKKTLEHMHQGGDMTYEELDVLLCKVANVLNDRPLGVRCHNSAEPAACPITPNLLLQGSRTTSARITSPYQGDKSLALRMNYIEETFQEWWVKWLTQVWDHLIPTKKWRTKERNVQPGDIVMVKFSGKMSVAEFRLGVIQAVKPDHLGQVRTAVVGMRPRDKRDATVPYKSKTLWTFEVSVQRLNVFLPVELQDELNSTPSSGAHLTHNCPDTPFNVPETVS